MTVRLLIVTDLHQQGVLYEQLTGLVSALRPDALVLCGDFLHGTGMLPYGRRPWLTPTQCADILARLPCPKFFIRGNHEDENWITFREDWLGKEKPNRVDGDIAAVGPLRFIGFPCSMGDATAFSEGRDVSGEHSSYRLDGIVKHHGATSCVFWLMHEPPTGTRLTMPGAATEGHPWWREAISVHQPLLVISDHDLFTPLRTGIWHDRIGRTVCVNAGQNMDGPLQATLVEAVFACDDAAVPETLRVIRQPDGVSVEVPCAQSHGQQH